MKVYNSEHCKLYAIWIPVLELSKFSRSELLLCFVTRLRKIWFNWMHCNVDFRTKLILVWIRSNFTGKGLWSKSISNKWNQAVWQTVALFCLLYTMSPQAPFTVYVYQFRRGFPSSNNWLYKVQSFYHQHEGSNTNVLVLPLCIV